MVFSRGVNGMSPSRPERLLNIHAANHTSNFGRWKGSYPILAPKSSNIYDFGISKIILFLYTVTDFQNIYIEAVVQSIIFIADWIEKYNVVSFSVKIV